MIAPDMVLRDGTRRIVIEVPARLASQLVFRRELRQPIEAEPRDGLTFTLCRSPLTYLSSLRGRRHPFCTMTTGKTLLKLLTSRRLFYMVSDRSDVVHYGWLTIGRCQYYHIGPRDVVIGPIVTLPSARGRGAATFATQAVMNELYSAGYRVFYIDTTHDNVSCLRVIEKCGFAQPVATYVRAESALS